MMRYLAIREGLAEAGREHFTPLPYRGAAAMTSELPYIVPTLVKTAIARETRGNGLAYNQHPTVEWGTRASWESPYRQAALDYGLQVLREFADKLPARLGKPDDQPAPSDTRNADAGKLAWLRELLNKHTVKR